MRTIAFVPIKLNSQRLPGKNILPIGGHPLCWHIVNTLLQVKGIDEVYVYCSDESVMQYLPEGVTFKKRDKRLDGNEVKGFEKALEYILSGECDSAFTAERIQTFAWYKGSPINYDLQDVPRTQDLEPVWLETSAFFMFKKEIFTEYNRRIGFHPYIHEVSGIEALDIDEQKDYDLAKVFCEMETK